MSQALAHHVESGDVTGLVAAIATDDATEIRTFGRAVQNGREMTGDSIFRLSSMTKPVTAALTAMLIDDGVIALHHPVTSWMPELDDRRVLVDVDGPLESTVPAEREITVEDLLTFTLGFGARWEEGPITTRARELGVAVGPPQPQSAPAPDDFLAAFGELPLMAHPGERWLYHTGSDLLGVLIERVLGQSFDAALAERVFQPLGMTDTGFWVEGERLERFTASYARDSSGHRVAYDEIDGQWARRPPFLSGGAGLASTAADYLRFARWLMEDHPAGSALAQLSLNQLSDAVRHRGGFFPDDFARRGWGYGVTVHLEDNGPGSRPGQYGWDGGMGTVFRNDPAHRATYVLLTNQMWTSPVPPPVADAFLAAAELAVLG
jgi:CubicO group peptidase (beta-lactamase class C family)